MSIDEAEEYSQRAALRALEARERYDAARPILPWLAVIALRLRRDERRRRVPDARTMYASPAPDELAIAREERARLTRAMESLPEVQRVAIRLFHEEGLSLREVATRLGLAVNTVKSHLHRARAELERRLRGSR